MDFSKVNGEIRSKEISSKELAKKKEEISVSFSEVLSGEKKTYSLPSIKEISVSSGPDCATISEGARMAYELSKIMDLIKNIPDIREEKIKGAYKLLEKGLDNYTINRKIAEELIDIFR
ncbi:TPA: hypothetical protein DCX16_03430 [bacterium]|nr:hypothetical protein [bacterium]